MLVHFGHPILVHEISDTNEASGHEHENGENDTFENDTIEYVPNPVVKEVPVEFVPSDEGGGEGSGDVDPTIQDSTTKNASKEQRNDGNSKNKIKQPAVSSMNKYVGWVIGITLGVICIIG